MHFITSPCEDQDWESAAVKGQKESSIFRTVTLKYTFSAMLQYFSKQGPFGAWAQPKMNIQMKMARRQFLLPSQMLTKIELDLLLSHPGSGIWATIVPMLNHIEPWKSSVTSPSPTTLVLPATKSCWLFLKKSLPLSTNMRSYCLVGLPMCYRHSSFHLVTFP